MVLGSKPLLSWGFFLKLYVLSVYVYQCLPTVLRHAGLKLLKLKIACEYETVLAKKKKNTAEDVTAHQASLKQRSNTSNCKKSLLITSSTQDVHVTLFCENRGVIKVTLKWPL